MKKSFIFSDRLAAAFIILPDEKKTEAFRFILEYGLDNLQNGGWGSEFQELSNIIDRDNKATIKASSEDISRIINYLNKICGTKYRASSANTRKLINARFNEGFSCDDFETVIRSKYSEWQGTRFERYLCPETLFGTKFEKYLNGKCTETFSDGGSFDTADFYDSAIMRAYGEKI